MQMSTCFGRGLRLQQAPASGYRQVAPSTPPAASPAVALGPSKPSHHPHHRPACLGAKGNGHRHAPIVAAASASDEPPARKAGSSSTRRREPRDSDRDRPGGRGGRGRGGGGHRRANSGDVDFRKWEDGRQERRTESDSRGRGGERGRGPYRPPRESGTAPSRIDRVSPRATLNRHLKDVESCQQLAQLLRNQPPEALTAVNVATSWVRLGSLQFKSNGARGRGAPSAADSGGGGGGGGGGDAAGDAGDGTASPNVAVVRQLLDPTAAVAIEMDLRQIANTLWGMAKVGDGVLKSCRPSRDSDRAQPSNSSSSGSSSSSGTTSSPDQAIRRLQQRAVELLQLLAPPPPPQGQQAQQQQESGGGGGGRGGGTQRLDIRDATQLWYGMAGLPYSWSEDLQLALEEATIQAMEAAVMTLAEGAADTAAPRRDRDGSSRGGGGGGHSSGWVESPTAVAQIVYRMSAVCGGRMGTSHRARLAAVVDALSYNGGDGYDDVDAASPPLDNPDCLLVGAQLLRLDLPPAAVRRLHDMALTLPPAVAARTGRTAMARALRSAVGLGLQPSAGEARRWQSRLFGEFCGQGWTCEELSWTMLALSYVKSYLPDAEARDELLGALRRLVRQLRANDATRVQQALGVWGLRLPEREAALLRQKASGSAGWNEPRAERGGGGGGAGGGGGGGGRGGGGGGGGGGAAFRSWGFAR